MEVIYFLSGAGAVLLLISVAFVSGLSKRVSELETEVDNLLECLDSTNQEISSRDIETNRRIDREIDRSNEITRNLEQQIAVEVKEIYSTIDSRLDKLDQKLSKQVIKG